jgi:hypothetical protein
MANVGAPLWPVVCTSCAVVMPHRIYFWRVQDRNGRWYKTRFRTTEEHIRKEHPEAERIDSDWMEVQRVDIYKPMQAGDE